RALLDALVALDVLARDEQAYRMRLPDAPPRPAVPNEGWGRLAEVIHEDRPLATTASDLPRYHAHLVRAGAAQAAEVAAQLASQLDPSSVLDLGGGAGTYTAAMLDAVPGAR